ncbi:hypothetical protein [Flagellimonas onchidii]|uniref:hypothetical protein n=1 Tax=Flagellimonas onchidii TaxID=2562684 RepID=UPI0010A5E561|nr:hypothetical protein [Allomuricauda onchidii]
MITADDKLLITKEINTIVVDYTKKVVIRKLLVLLSFESTSDCEVVTDLIRSLNFYGMNAKPTELEFQLSELLEKFIENLKKEEQTALHFWTLNQKYLYYLEEFECDDDRYFENEFDKRFGRELAHKIYDPNNSNLRQDTFQELNNFLSIFASELDLSIIDEFTAEQILEEIDRYCLHA